MQPDNPGRPIERAEHDDHPAVLAKMCSGLGTAAGVVLVSNLPRAENPECIAAFRRCVDVAVLSKGRRGDKEHALLGNPGREVRINMFVFLTHSDGWRSATAGGSRSAGGCWLERAGSVLS